MCLKMLKTKNTHIIKYNGKQVKNDKMKLDKKRTLHPNKKTAKSKKKCTKHEQKCFIKKNNLNF